MSLFDYIKEELEKYVEKKLITIHSVPLPYEEEQAVLVMDRLLPTDFVMIFRFPSENPHSYYKYTIIAVQGGPVHQAFEQICVYSGQEVIDFIKRFFGFRSEGVKK